MEPQQKGHQSRGRQGGRETENPEWQKSDVDQLCPEGVTVQEEKLWTENDRGSSVLLQAFYSHMNLLEASS